MNFIVSAVFAMKQALTSMKMMIFEITLKVNVYSFLSHCSVFLLKTQFIADTGDDLPELRLTSIPNSSQQLPELRNIFELSKNAIR